MLNPVPTDKARQGRRGVQVLLVLVIALLLAMGAWWVAEYYGAAIEPPTDQQIGDPAEAPKP